MSTNDTLKPTNEELVQAFGKGPIVPPNPDHPYTYEPFVRQLRAVADAGAAPVREEAKRLLGDMERALDGIKSELEDAKLRLAGLCEKYPLDVVIERAHDDVDGALGQAIAALRPRDERERLERQALVFGRPCEDHGYPGCSCAEDDRFPG